MLFRSEKIRNCGCSCGILPVLRDIDEPEDLKAYWNMGVEECGRMRHTWDYLEHLNSKYGFR